MLYHAYMHASVQCDGRIEIKENVNTWNPLILTYKQIDIRFNDRQKCDISFSVTAGQLKPSATILIEVSQFNRVVFNVEFEFPFELRKIALDTFEDLTIVMNRMGLINTASQLEETPQSAT
jgi:hypothetical protein